jgi:Methyltransferase domain
VELPFGLNPYENDPGAWSASLINDAEMLLGLLDGAGVRSLVEIGAYAGDLTRLLLLWGDGHGARIIAVDPSPQPELEQLERERDGLELIRETSLKALAHVEPTDAVIIDGDHNYYTVTHELRLIEQRWTERGSELPLILLHDVGWPHGRRDNYYDPTRVPEEYRQPIAAGGGLYPGITGIRPGGLPYPWPAAEEGGPRNGVLTAVEDFMAGRDDLRLFIFPPFFGLGVVFRARAPYAEALTELLEPWHRHPLLERLERNRVLHLASSHVQLSLAHDAQEQNARQHALLEAMLASRAFAAAELFLRMRQLGKPSFSRQQIRRVLRGQDAAAAPTGANGAGGEPEQKPDAAVR